MESNIFAILRELNREEYKNYTIALACRSDYRDSVEKKLQHYGLRVDHLVKFGSIFYYRMLSKAGFSSMTLRFRDALLKRMDRSI